MQSGSGQMQAHQRPPSRQQITPVSSHRASDVLGFICRGRHGRSMASAAGGGSGHERRAGSCC
jgi:hypothetical protein